MKPGHDPFESLDAQQALRIEDICSRFEAAWQADGRPKIEEHLDEVDGQLRPVLLQQLLLLELELRGWPAVSVEVDVYRKRFPKQVELIETVFALEDDTEGQVTHLPASPIPTIGPGQFGDFELFEVLGRGGMGVVYKARHSKLGRLVALKTIAPHQLATEEAVTRFDFEAAAAAKLDHPGIVPVFETGTHDGHHYMAMALVNGESLAAKVQSGPLVPNDAARYVLAAAQAVHYAHEQGVVHRDLKPANILLDEADQPRIVDFGLAKRVEVDSNLTTSGQLLGTPSYMPPEQALGSEDVGRPSDVYALGAVLYCLLTGRPPLQAATLAETIVQILEVEPASPRTLNPAVSRDLDTICMRCLNKEPGQRYASARELAKELERVLQGRPIKARPISSVGRLYRWSRRNPALAAVSCALSLSLVAGIITAWWFAWRASERAAEARFQATQADVAAGRERAAQQEATAEAEKAKAIKDYLVLDMFMAATPEARGRDIKVVEVLAAAAANVASRFADQPDTQAEVRLTLGRTYLRLGFPQKGLSQLQLAERQFRKSKGDHDRATLAATVRIGQALDQLDRLSEARALLEQSEKVCLEQFGERDELTLVARAILGETLQTLGQHNEARKRLTETLKILEENPQQNANMISAVISSLAGSLMAEGKLAEAESCYRKWLALPGHADSGGHRLAMATAGSNLATLLQKRGQLVEAEKLLEDSLAKLRKILVPNDWRIALTEGNYALCLIRQKRHREALPFLRTSYEKLQVALGQDDFKTERMLNELFLLLDVLEDADGSEKYNKQSFITRLRNAGPGEEKSVREAFILYDGVVVARHGQEVSAKRRDELIAYGNALPTNDRRRGRFLTNWGRCMVLKRSWKNTYHLAEPIVLAGYTSNRDQLGANHRDTLWSLETVVRYYQLWKKPEQAAKYQDLLNKSRPVPSK